MAAALFSAVAAMAFAGGGADEGAASTAPAGGTEVSGGPQIWATVTVYEQEAGNRVSSFNESPMLAALVSSGELPPVDERVSAEPMVVLPYDSIGRYGGTLRGKSVRPAGDDDIITNDKLTPSTPGWLLPGGEIVTVTKLDHTTVRFGFSVPYPPMLSILSNLINTPVFAPKHYLQKWHIAHTDDATAVAKQEGFDDWWGAFVFHPAFLVAAIGHNRPSRVRHRR
jgi:hypothetical protein